MNNSDWILTTGIFLFALFSLKPAIGNFKVVLRDKYNSRVSSFQRKLILFWLGLGCVCIVIALFFIPYSVLVKLGYLPDFKL